MKTLFHNLTSAMFRNTIRTLGTFSLLTMLTSGEVHAQRAPGAGAIIPSHGTWTQVASACTFDEDTIDSQFGGAGVSFSDSATGDITLRCNITNVMDPDSPWSALEVVYRDPDGSATANQVKVTLHKAGLDGTAETLVTTLDPVTRRPRSVTDPSLIATFDSNSVASASSSTQVHSVGVSHAFDFATNAYYVKVRVKRDAGSTTNPAAFIIRLNGVIFFG